MAGGIKCKARYKVEIDKVQNELKRFKIILNKFDAADQKGSTTGLHAKLHRGIVDLRDILSELHKKTTNKYY